MHPEFFVTVAYDWQAMYMETSFAVTTIAHIHNDFEEKFGIPRQSGLVPAMQSVIVFEKEYRNDDSLRGIEGYSHLWLIWQFSASVRKTWSPTVRPPRLGGNQRVGVFATRSPFRPNALGLSSVSLLGIDHTEEHGTILRVAGADLMNGTPIFDIKPYIAYTDAHPDAVCGFVDEVAYQTLQVQCPETLLATVEPEKRPSLMGVLEQDPRPAYHHDEDRIYHMDFGLYTVAFRVKGNQLIVCDIQKRIS